MSDQSNPSSTLEVNHNTEHPIPLQKKITSALSAHETFQKQLSELQGRGASDLVESDESKLGGRIKASTGPLKLEGEWKLPEGFDVSTFEKVDGDDEETELIKLHQARHIIKATGASSPELVAQTTKILEARPDIIGQSDIMRVVEARLYDTEAGGQNIHGKLIELISKPNPDAISVENRKLIRLIADTDPNSRSAQIDGFLAGLEAKDMDGYKLDATQKGEIPYPKDIASALDTLGGSRDNFSTPHRGYPSIEFNSRITSTTKESTPTESPRAKATKIGSLCAQFEPAMRDASNNTLKKKSQELFAEAVRIVLSSSPEDLGRTVRDIKKEARTSPLSETISLLDGVRSSNREIDQAIIENDSRIENIKNKARIEASEAELTARTKAESEAYAMVLKNEADDAASNLSPVPDEFLEALNQKNTSGLYKRLSEARTGTGLERRKADHHYQVAYNLDDLNSRLEINRRDPEFIRQAYETKNRIIEIPNPNLKGNFLDLFRRKILKVGQTYQVLRGGIDLVKILRIDDQPSGGDNEARKVAESYLKKYYSKHCEYVMTAPGIWEKRKKIPPR